MTKLQEQQEVARAELARISQQIVQEEIREGTAENVKKVNRLLIDLENSVTFCRLPMVTAAHVKMAMGSEFCDPGKCFHGDTCQEILQLTRKGKGKGKKGNGSNVKGEWSSNPSTISEKYVTKGQFIIRVDSGVYIFKGTDYKATVAEIAATLAGKASLRQIGGYRHKGDAKKGHPYFSAFNGSGKAMGKPITVQYLDYTDKHFTHTEHVQLASIDEDTNY